MWFGTRRMDRPRCDAQLEGLVTQIVGIFDISFSFRSQMQFYDVIVE